MNNQLEQIKQLLASSSKEQRQDIFRELRHEFPIHAIEQKLNAEAEIILEAISRAGDLTLRGIRGIIAEAAFATKMVGMRIPMKSPPIPKQTGTHCGANRQSEKSERSDAGNLFIA